MARSRNCLSITTLPAIPEYARPGIAAARAADIVINYPTFDRLMPNRPSTRAEVAAFVYQALVKDGKAPPVAAAGGRWQKEPITTLPIAARSFSFSADGQRLLAITAGETKLQVWNTQTGALIREIAAGDGDSFQTVAINKDGDKVAAVVGSPSGSTAKTVELAVWDIETGQPLWRKTIFEAGLAITADTFAGARQVTYSPDNQQIMTLVNKAKIFIGDDIVRYAGTKLDLWNTADGEVVQSLGVGRIAEDEGVVNFAMSPNDQFLAVQYQAQPARLVDLWQRNQRGLFEYVRTLPQEYGYWWEMDMLFRNDGWLNVLTRSSDNALLATWNPQTGNRLTKTNLPVDFPSDIAIRLSPDGDSYFVAGLSGSRLGSVKTGNVQDWLGGPVVFSDHGNYLAAANLDEATPSISIYVKTVP